MTSNFEECPTGILVDYIGNTTSSVSPYSDNEKECEDNLNVEDAILSKSSCGTEELSFGCQTPFVNIGAHNIPSNQYLGYELNRKKDEMGISKIEWRSPSPTTMNMITREASRIVDQLHTTLETSLWEEEFPMSDDDCFEEFSNESEEASQIVTLTKCSSVIEESPCFIKENNSIEKSNLPVENPKVIDNSVTEENSGVPKMYFTVSSSLNNSNLKYLQENSGTAEKDYENAVENSVETKETCDLLKESICVTTGYTTTELNNAITEEKYTVCEGNVIFQKCNSLTVEGCSATKEGCAATKASCTATKEGCATEEDCTMTESRVATEEDCTVTEGCDTTEEDCTEEGCAVIEEGCAVIEEGCDMTEEGCDMTEEGCDMTEKGCDTTEESFAMTKKKCVAIKERCIVSEENSNLTREISTHAEKIGFVAEDNFNVLAEFSDTDTNPIAKISSEKSLYTNTDIKQKHTLSEETVEANKAKPIETTPLSMKSKLTKIFKTPSFKTPIKYKKLEEKENVMQEKEKNALSDRQISKVGQVSFIKGIFSGTNSKRAVVSTSKSIIKTPLNKNIVGKISFGRENKATIRDQTKEKLDTPLKRMNPLKFQPASSTKTPLCKSNSVVETPSTTKAIRRSSSFQTRQLENSYQIKREMSFMAESRPKSFNSRMSLSQTQRIGNELQTPSKIGSFLPKSTPKTFATPFSSKSAAKEPQVACPSFGSALKAPVQNCPKVVGFMRPASTTSKTRFTSGLELPSPLPKMLNDNLPRQLFPDYNTPLKRRM